MWNAPVDFEDGHSHVVHLVGAIKLFHPFSVSEGGGGSLNEEALTDVTECSAF